MEIRWLKRRRKRKISESMKGKYVSVETRKKMSESNKGKHNKGKPLSWKLERKYLRLLRSLGGGGNRGIHPTNR